MDSFNLLIDPLLLLLLVIILCWFIYAKTISPKSIPGPCGLPIVGILFSLGKFPPIKLSEWKKKYGDIYSIKMGNRYAVVVNSLEGIKEVLIDRSLDYAARPDFLSWDYLFGGDRQQSVAFADNHSKQKQIKMFLMKTLRPNNNFMKSVEEKILFETQHLLKEFKKYDRIPFDPKDHIIYGIANIILQFLYNKRYEQNDPDLKKFLTNISEHTNLLGPAVALVDYIPWLYYFNKKIINVLIHITNGILRNAEKELAEHKLTFNNHHQRDFIDKLLGEMEKEPQERIINEISMPAIIDIMAAGFDTTTNLLHFGILYLINWPEVQEKIHSELDHVIGRNRIVSLHDRANLPYIDATILEIERYASIIPFVLPHKTKSDVNLQGYFIPKDTIILPNVWSVHKDPRYWDEPEKFKPERFLDENGKITSSDKIFLFGGGRRLCAGKNLAKAEMFLFLTGILQQMELKSAPDIKEYDLTPEYSLVLQPKPYKIVAVMRK